jgi:hypothetical protein
MLRGSFQRAAMAILLIGMMIAPFATCLQQGHKGAHSCCMPSERSHSLRTNCCTVRTQLPATLAAPTLPRTSSLSAVYVAFRREAMPVSFERPAVAAIPPLSPPPGAFILRL